MTDLESRSLHIELEENRTILPETGFLGQQEGCWTNLEPVFVNAGEILLWKKQEFEYQLFFYSTDIVPELIHTYSYQNESNWTTFRLDLSDLLWKSTAHCFARTGYFRVAVRKAEGAQGGAAPGLLADVAELTSREGCRGQADVIKPWLQEEAAHVCERALETRGSQDFTAFLLTDTHYAIGCNWPDTLAGIRMCGERICPDAVIHLGDLTDGILPLRYTQRFALRVTDGLRSLGVPLYMCVGNHDANYFRGNREFLSNRQCGEFYLKRKETSYFIDWPDHGLRTIFLNSFEPKRKQRYGFSLMDLFRMKTALSTLPDGWRVLVFSHVPPLAKLHVWSDTIYNGDRMLGMLEKFAKKRKHSVLGWVHGHNHADQVCNDMSFPIISIGCSKTEDFKEHKPDGSETFSRQPGTRTQELWDVLIVGKDSRRLEFIRFGAGNDRSVLSDKGMRNEDRTGRKDAAAASIGGAGAFKRG